MDDDNEIKVILGILISLLLVAVVVIIAFILIIGAIIGTIFGGLVEILPGPPPLESVTSYVDMNYSEVVAFNHSTAKSEMEDLGYSIYESSPHNEHDTYFNFHDNHTLGDIWSRTYENGSQEAEFYISYRPYQNDSHQNTTLAFEYMKLKAEEIASICNITLDWDLATIIYDPEWYYGREGKPLGP